MSLLRGVDNKIWRSREFGPSFASAGLGNGVRGCSFHFSILLFCIAEEGLGFVPPLCAVLGVPTLHLPSYACSVHPPI